MNRPISDLAQFAAMLEQKGQLKRIDVPVDPLLEISEITDRVCKKGGPALLFSHVNGSDHPVVTNLFGTSARMSAALGVRRLDDLGARLRRFLSFAELGSVADAARALPGLARAAAFFPRKVRSAPCRAVRCPPDLNALPALQCWPGDAGRFLTLPVVVTRDPETGRHNLGMYRMQVFSSTEAGMHWHLHKDGRSMYESYRRAGKRMPVAVALGGDPATIFAATAPLPPMIGEYLLAGFLRGAPVDITLCRELGLYVPARAEFILEGYVDPAEPLRPEGPFGDHTGVYSPVEDYPVFHLTGMTRREKPLFPATIVGRPPMEDAFLGKATERLFLPLLQLQLPELTDLRFPVEGGFHNCAVASIKKRYPGQARKVMNALWGMGQMMYTKLIVVVDDDIPAKNLSLVVWRALGSVDASRDLTVSPGPLDALDHASPHPRFGGRLGVDATRKWPEEGHPRPWPDDAVMDEAMKKKVDERWRAYGLN